MLKWMMIAVLALGLSACGAAGTVKEASEQTVKDVANYIPENNQKRQEMRAQVYELITEKKLELQREDPIKAMLFLDCVYPALVSPQLANAINNIDLDDDVNPFEFLNELVPDCVKDYQKDE